jgi:electron-transferring-flavoprotein dehydrogenase
MIRARGYFSPSYTRLLHTTTFKRQRASFDPVSVDRVEDEVDVCIVGAGPAGLSAAIRLKQLERERGRDVRVVVLEKGAEVGGHLPSTSHARSLVLKYNRLAHPFWSSD